MYHLHALLLSLLRNKLRYTLGTRLDEPQSRSGLCGEEKTVALPEITTEIKCNGKIPVSFNLILNLKLIIKKVKKKVKLSP
jgi:hypothetical protein